NGSSNLRGLRGEANLDTSNGRIDVEDFQGTVRAETSNGTISFLGSLAAGGENALETSNGSVTVRLTGDPHIDLDAATSNGRVESELPIDAQTRERDRIVGRIGEGGTVLRIRTSNGSINLEQAD
ncbi:MAG: DUF4097 family beta strand repeat-containing protein, partial [Chloroflexota bacterium]